MPYIIYKDNIDPPLEGDETFEGLAFFAEYDAREIAPVLAENGFSSSFPTEPASFEVPCSKDEYSYSLGVAECELVVAAGAVKYAELSREYAKTETGFEVAITYDDKPLPLEGFDIDVWAIPKITVLERIKAVGKKAEIEAALKSDWFALQEWSAASEIHSNNVEILAMFAALGIDADVILSPVGL